MQRLLARLADFAYHRRGRMVVAWIVAAVAVIGLGSSLADDFRAEYATAGRSVIVAGGTVVIAMLGLVLTGLPYIYGVAVPGRPGSQFASPTPEEGTSIGPEPG